MQIIDIEKNFKVLEIAPAMVAVKAAPDRTVDSEVRLKIAFSSGTLRKSSAKPWLRQYFYRAGLGLAALVTVANLTSYCTRDGALAVFHYPLFGYAVIAGESGGFGFYREPVDVVRIESLPFHGTFANLCAEVIVLVHLPRFIAASTN